MPRDPVALDLISLISECGSAKEVIMAAQEIFEGLEQKLRDDEETEDLGKDENTNNARKMTANPPMTQLTTLVGVLTAAIPRLKLRRKSASETIKPLFEELRTIVDMAVPKALKNETRVLLGNITDLVRRVGEWSQRNNALNKADQEACAILMRRLLENSVSTCSQKLQTDIAQRTLEKCYPRLAVRSKVSPDSEEGQRVVLDTLHVADSLGMREDHGSTLDLLFSAYEPSESNPQGVISRLLSLLTSCIHTSHYLDEALAVLIYCLHKHSGYLPDEIILPLCGLIPTVASAHPNPSARHQAFRVLSLLLQRSDAQIRFHQLMELTKNSEYPQMRATAVGLVKEALLESLSKNQKNDPFLSSLFLRSFGPILFRTNPPDLLSSSLSLKDFQESQEPSRLVECLSLFYVLLQRDDKNKTGIRDKDAVKSVENNLLRPLQEKIDQWTSDPAVSTGHDHDITTIVSLKISLERIQSAREALHIV
ncbi:hypothetical protein CPC08DRAFT_741429 [Agrocybe pediades]|nr:hypothetical protein CPC08DRAFT_741429 [Agrocybe pediades]